MSVAQDLRAEWDRLIDDMTLWMTHVVLGPQQWRELRAAPDKDDSLQPCEESPIKWCFRCLPIKIEHDLDGWRIETKKE